MAFMQISNNIKMYYEANGQEQSIVLIAGHGADHTFWEPIRAKLADYFNVVVFDNVGVGQTEEKREDALELEGMADVIMMLIDKLQLKTPHILGQSMGGALAQFLARKYSEKLGKVILLNTASKLNTVTFLALESLLMLREENISLEGLMNAELPWFFSSHFLKNSSNIEEVKSAILNNPFPQSIDNERRQLVALKAFDSRKWLHEIKNKTLVIASQSDLIALPQESQDLANNIHGAQFMIIPGGHSSVLEYPEQLVQIISGFLTV